MSSSLTLGELVQRWMGTRLQFKTDLAGRLKAWPRLFDGDRCLAGSTLVGSLGEDPQLRLGWVANQELMVELLVKHKGEEQRVLTGMASAIPVAILLDYLRDWLKLGEGPLRLSMADRVLGGAEILADVSSEDERISLRVERVESQ